MNVGEISGLVWCGITTPVAVVIVFKGFAMAFALNLTALPFFKALPLSALALSLVSAPSPPFVSSSGSSPSVAAAAAALASSSRALISSRISPMVFASSMRAVNSSPLLSWASLPTVTRRAFNSFLLIFINCSLFMLLSSLSYSMCLIVNAAILLLISFSLAAAWSLVSSGGFPPANASGVFLQYNFV